MNPNTRSSSSLSIFPHIGHFTKLNDSMSSPSGNILVGREKIDFQERSAALLLAPSNDSRQLEHVCNCGTLIRHSLWLFDNTLLALNARFSEYGH
jgi:hypothetical protein